jgi:3-polyprenyl-4-hydroxybenzoate decarboxylase
LLFENVNQSKVPVLGGVFATRKRALLPLETSEKECAEKFHRALEHSNLAAKISSGPCKEVWLKLDASMAVGAYDTFLGAMTETGC